MPKSWNNIKNLIAYSKEGIFSKVIFKGDSGDVTLFCMAAGTEMSEHTSTKDAVVYVVEGDGVFVLGNEKIKMIPGIIINMPKDSPHSLKVKENTSFLLSLHR